MRTIILSLAAITLMIVSCDSNKSKNQGTTQEQIENLGSNDFHTSRKAQSFLIDEGRIAIPDLLEAFGSPGSETKRALICSVVGDIAPDIYHEMLLRSNSVENVCIFAKYFNSSAIKKLSPEQIIGIKKHYAELPKIAPQSPTSCADTIVRTLNEIQP